MTRTPVRRRRKRTTDDERGSRRRHRLAALLAPALERETAGDPAAAETLLREVLARHPQLADAHLALARCLQAQGRSLAAAEALRGALRVRPRSREARTRLGALCIETGDYAGAVRCFSEFVMLVPDDAEMQTRLGLALLGADRVADAVGVLRTAIGLDPDQVEAHLRLGQALYVLGRSAESIESFHRVLALHGDHPAAHLGLGHALLSRGRLEEAHECYRRALALEPTLAGASLGLARSRRFGPGDEGEVGELESLLERQDLSREARADLHFALGKILDDLERYEGAFGHYAAGNRLAGEAVRFDRAQLERAVSGLIEVFSPAYFAERAGFGVESDSPVFVVGMPRSGTTLVEQIIARHPDAYGAGERSEIDELTRDLGRVTGSGPAYPRSALSITGEHARALAGRYLATTRGLAGGALRVVDKMPENFFHLGFIATLFPGARIIHCRRAPLDVCLSAYFQQFDRGHAWAYELANIAEFYRGYARLMAHWRTVLPIPIHEVDYERLVAEPATVGRALIEHCGLAWDERCLAPDEDGPSVLSASNWQVRQPIYTGSVARWRHYEAYLVELKAGLEGLLDEASAPGGDAGASSPADRAVARIDR